MARTRLITAGERREGQAEVLSGLNPGEQAVTCVTADLAAAVVVGSLVILFDPIFQGLAIALMAGEIASLALSRMTVPIVYYLVNRGKS